VEPGPQSRRLRLARGVFGCMVPFLVIGGLLFGLGFAGAAFLVTAVPGGFSPLPFAAGADGGVIGSPGCTAPERTADYVEVAQVAEEIALARGPLADVVELAFSVLLPAGAHPGGEAPPHGRVGWELRAWADVPGRDPEAVVPLRVAVR